MTEKKSKQKKYDNYKINEANFVLKGSREKMSVKNKPKNVICIWRLFCFVFIYAILVLFSNCLYSCKTRQIEPMVTTY